MVINTAQERIERRLGMETGNAKIMLPARQCGKRFRRQYAESDSFVDIVFGKGVDAIEREKVTAQLRSPGCIDLVGQKIGVQVDG